MNRRQFILSSTTFALGAGFGASASGYGGFAGLASQAPAQPAAPPVTRFEELRRGVGMFIGQGGTIGYLVNADGAVAVDSQFMNTATICAAGLKERAPKGIAMLLNTHHHGDHTGGNKAYGVSKIVAHANCLASHKKVTEEAKTVADQAYATATFTDLWTEKFGNETIEMRHLGPGSHRRRCGDPPSSRPTSYTWAICSSIAPIRTSIARRVRASTTGSRYSTSWPSAASNRHHLHRRPRARTITVRNTRAELTHFRNYLTAVARSRPRRCQGRPIEGGDPEAAGAEGLRGQRRLRTRGSRWRSCSALPTTK